MHPELSVALGSAKDSYVIGFALGTPARLPEVNEAVHELHKGYQPIVKSRWKVGDFVFERMAFAILPDARRGCNGDRETGRYNSRLSDQWRRCAATTALVLLTGAADGSQNKDDGYGPFLAPLSRWQHKEIKVAPAPGSLLVGGRVLLAYHSSAPTPVAFQSSFKAVQGRAGKTDRTEQWASF